MEETINNSSAEAQGREFQKFAWLRILAALVLAAAVLWAISWLSGTLGGGTAPRVEKAAKHGAEHTETAAHETQATSGAHTPPEQQKTAESGHAAAGHETADHGEGGHAEKAAEHGAEPTESAAHEGHAPAGAETHPEQQKTAESGHAAAGHETADHGEGGHGPSALDPADYETKGAFFVDSLIQPIHYELNERFWGWRPNDILNFTDNVNEMQLGILELTRRATVALTEKISRPGSASALNPHLENAMNAFMIGADSYWMPSAESKYNEAIKELKEYKRQLQKNQATFFTRSDSLIPLLQKFEELLGSCDENLVKQKEDNGEPVSTFQADNYFYYAKGVAHALVPILHAVGHEFDQLLKVRGATDILHHAAESAHHAAVMDPWLLVTDASLDGILANHRANMAAHISHARYYLGVLVKTLST